MNRPWTRRYEDTLARLSRKVPPGEMMGDVRERALAELVADGAAEERERLCKEAKRRFELIADKHVELSDAFDENEKDEESMEHAGASFGAIQCIRVLEALRKARAKGSDR